MNPTARFDISGRSDSEEGQIGRTGPEHSMSDPMIPAARKKRRAAAIAVLILVALGLRIAFVSLAKEHDSNLAQFLPLASETEFLKQGTHSSDSEEYRALAQGLRQGAFGWDGKPGAFRAPGYPLFLAVFGTNLSVLLLVQVLLSVGTVLLVWAGARRLFGDKAGLVAAAFLALDLASVLLAGVVMAETLFVFLVVLGGYLFMLKRFPWAGFALGTAVLVRPVGILLFVPFGIALVVQRKWRPLVLFLVLFAILPGLWVGRNLVRFGRPGFTTDGAFNLYYTNCAILVQEQTGMNEEAVRALLAKEAAQKPEEDNPLVLSARITGLALRRIAADPVRYAWIHLRGIGRIVFGVQADEMVMRITGTHTRPSLFKLTREQGIGAGIILLVAFELLLTLAALVLAAGSIAARRPRGVRLLILAIGCYFFIMASPLTNGRLRVPAMPFIYIVAAGLFAESRKRNPKRRKPGQTRSPRNCSSRI